jgi:hypothetical protein
MASVTEWSGASSAMHLLSILNGIMSGNGNGNGSGIANFGHCSNHIRQFGISVRIGMR